MPLGAGEAALEIPFLSWGVLRGEARRSSDGLFIEEYGLCFLTLPFGVVTGESESLFFAAGFGDPAFEYA